MDVFKGFLKIFFAAIMIVLAGMVISFIIILPEGSLIERMIESALSCVVLFTTVVISARVIRNT
jgi:hypothetical protein